jgi:hypothetical protein
MLLLLLPRLDLRFKCFQTLLNSRIHPPEANALLVHQMQDLISRAKNRPQRARR